MQEDFSPEKYLNDEKLLRLTINQLEKDFNELGESIIEEIRFFEFEKLVFLLSEKLIDLKKKRSGILSQLFYRIDIPEEKINLINDGENRFFENISVLILKRELQKVVIREYYKNKFNDES